jgi:hypothetical protein
MELERPEDIFWEKNPDRNTSHVVVNVTDSPAKFYMTRLMKGRGPVARNLIS